MLHLASGREWRGGQRQVFFLARALAQYPDIDSTVITGRGTILASRLAEAGVDVQGVPWGPGFDPRAAWRAIRASNRDAIVHAHDGHAFLIADLATRARRARLVVTRRDMSPIRHPARYRRADAAIAISQAVAGRLHQADVDPARIIVIPSAVEAPVTPRAAGADGAVVVCLAALEHGKGIDVLLRAAARMRHARSDVRWIVGGNGSKREALERLRDALELRGIVDLVGFVADTDQLFARATVVVQPSRLEALGSSVLDALAHGVPVVAASTGGLTEALAHGGGVLVPPDDPGELARQVQRLMDDPAERGRLSREATAAAAHFAIAPMVARTVDVYRSLDRNHGTQ